MIVHCLRTSRNISADKMSLRRSRTISDLHMKRLWHYLALTAAMLVSSAALAHGVAAGDQGYIEQTSGPQIGAFLYLGAKHMVTGYDHLLFLFG